MLYLIRSLRYHPSPRIRKMRGAPSLHHALILLVCISASRVNSANPSWTVKGTNTLQYTQLTEGENNTFVGTLLAIDGDSGDDLTYGIIDTASDVLGGNPYINAALYLAVDPDSGDVTIVSPVDRESAPTLLATWTAHDGTTLIPSDPVTMYVSDVNDNIPQIENLPSRLEPSLKEDSLYDTLVTTFIVVDKDTGYNGEVTVAIVGHDEDDSCDDNPFIVQESGSPKEFKILLNGTLDYSTESQYIVCLNATDQGRAIQLSSSTRVIIPIEDAQNLGPVFLNEPYSSELLEDVELGTSVVQVRAQDGDRGVPSPNRVVYSLSETSQTFAIHSDTGLITVIEQVDRENLEQNPFQLAVNATEIDDSQPISQRTSTTTVFVTILDVDDEKPEFEKTSSTVDLLENLPPGTPLNIGVMVTDGDEVGNSYFELFLEQPYDTFRLQETSTVGGSLNVDVRVNNSEYLDFELYRELNFTVVVRDYEDQSRLEVTVNIINVNDNDPQFLEASYNGEFPEDVSAGYTILEVSASDEDVDDVVTYAIDPPVSYFEINSTTGVITIPPDVRFDAETNTDFLFTVEASDGERISQTLVTLNCLDVNDETPTFQKHQSQIFENEFEFNASHPRDSIFSFQAYDGDIAAPNNKFLFSIAGGDENDTFYIDPETGDLFFADSVDFEGPEGITEYHLLIQAEDEGQPPLAGNTTLTVVIEDVNDNSPQFSEEIYYFSVMEDAANQEEVARVTASDADSDLFGTVFYSIDSGGQGNFYIMEAGDIHVGGSLDKERGSKDGYLLEVTARDGGAPPLEGSCLVNITIIDVNDEDPVFEDDHYEVSVPENVTDSSTIKVIEASDPDENSDLRYEMDGITAYDDRGAIIQGDYSNQFIYGETDGVLAVNQPLDRETVAMYVMNITVEDVNATSLQQDKATVTIVVLDVNDLVPVFDHPIPSLSVIEESPIGTVISTDIQATDGDQGLNGDIVYSLDEDAGGRVAIDESEGTLTVENRVDRETIEVLPIIIRATDGGSPPLWTVVQVDISVIDTNDNVPVFEEANYIDEVIENTPVGASVITVNANDADSPEYADIEYTIQGGNTGDWFKIDNSTGNISVNIAPDREIADTVFLAVTAIGSGGFQGSTLVTITILDENDNSPDFIKFEEYIKTSVNIGKGSVITTIVATDPDAGPAGTVLYNALEGNGTALFDVHQLSGEVSTIIALEDLPGLYELVIEAADNGTEAPPMGYERQTMAIFVDDISSTPPAFVVPTDGQIIEMMEGFNQPDVPILTATAVDEDYGDEGEVAYRLVPTGGNEDWSKFKVDNMTGELFYIAEPPDWSENPEFNLFLEAYNYLTDLEYNDRVEFTIEVIDLPNHEPGFVDPDTGEPLEPVTMEIVENSGTGAPIGSVSAEDKDKDTTIYYFIIGGNEAGYFQIHRITGVISTSGDLDRDVGTATYELLVKATEDEFYDAGTRGRRATEDEAEEDLSILTVLISVVDLNDNPPVFQSDRFVAGVVSTVEYGVLVTRVEAIDKDTDTDNTQVYYNITEHKRLNLDKEVIGEDEAFYIDSRTGDVYTLASFQTLKQGIYFELSISVVDPSEPRYADNTELVIYVILTGQQLKVHTLVSAEETRQTVGDLESDLEATFASYDSGKYSVVFDGISSYTFEDKVIQDQAESLFHVVNVTSDVFVVKPDDVLYILDHSHADVDTFKNDYSVNTIYVANYTPPVPLLTTLQLALTTTAIALLVILVLAGMAFLFDQNRRQGVLQAIGYNEGNKSDDSSDLGTDNDAYNDSDEDVEYRTIAHPEVMEEEMDFEDDGEEEEDETISEDGHGYDYIDDGVTHTYLHTGDATEATMNTQTLAAALNAHNHFAQEGLGDVTDI